MAAFASPASEVRVRVHEGMVDHACPGQWDESKSFASGSVTPIQPLKTTTRRKGHVFGFDCDDDLPCPKKKSDDAPCPKKKKPKTWDESDDDDEDSECGSKDKPVPVRRPRQKGAHHEDDTTSPTYAKPETQRGKLVVTFPRFWLRLCTVEDKSVARRLRQLGFKVGQPYSLIIDMDYDMGSPGISPELRVRLPYLFAEALKDLPMGLEGIAISGECSNDYVLGLFADPKTALFHAKRVLLRTFTAPSAPVVPQISLWSRLQMFAMTPNLERLALVDRERDPPKDPTLSLGLLRWLTTLTHLGVTHWIYDRVDEVMNTPPPTLQQIDVHGCYHAAPSDIAGAFFKRMLSFTPEAESELPQLTIDATVPVGKRRVVSRFVDFDQPLINFLTDA